MKGLLVFILTACVIPAETVKLTVKIVDAVTLAGIPGAKVQLVRTPYTFQPIPEQTTDAGGSFTVDAPAPGRIWVPEIKAAGYAAPDTNTFIEIRAEPLTVTYKLTRTGTLSGRLVDADSGDPIPGANVEPLLVNWVRGRRELQRARTSVVTQKDGGFSLCALRLGDYALDVNSFSSDGRLPPLTGYPQIVWPGGGDLQSAAPFNLTYGADLRIGEVKLRKRDLAKLVVTVDGGQCPAGRSYDVTLNQFSFSSSFARGFTKSPCGGAATFNEVTPGDYEIDVQAAWQAGEQREEAAVSVLVVKGEDKVSVTVTPPILVRGKVTVDRDAAAPSKLEAHLWARGSKLTGYFSHIRSFGASKISSDGTFDGRAYVPAGGEIQVDISPLPPTYYIREVRYDRAVHPGDTFVIHGGAAQQDLGIVLSDRAATLTGTVRTDDGKVVPGAKVLLTAWPADVVTDYPFGVAEASSDPSGAYAFAHLRPGVYRLVAVPAAVRPKLEEPGVMLALFASAESFELAEAGSAVRQLAPVVPAR